MESEAYFHVKIDTNTNVFIQLRRQRSSLESDLLNEISLRGSPFPRHGTGTFQLDCNTVSLAAGWNGLTFELNWKTALCMLANTGRETV